MKKELNSIETVANGAKVLMLVGRLSRLYDEGINSETLGRLASEGCEKLTISEFWDGLLYCHDKGLITQADNGTIHHVPEVDSLVGSRLLEAMALALENICIVRNGVLDYPDFMDDDNEELLFAAMTYNLPEECISVIREFLLEWHLVRLDGIGNIVAE